MFLKTSSRRLTYDFIKNVPFWFPGFSNPERLGLHQPNYSYVRGYLATTVSFRMRSRPHVPHIIHHPICGRSNKIIRHMRWNLSFPIASSTPFANHGMPAVNIKQKPTNPHTRDLPHSHENKSFALSPEPTGSYWWAFEMFTNNIFLIIPVRSRRCVAFTISAFTNSNHGIVTNNSSIYFLLFFTANSWRPTCTWMGIRNIAFICCHPFHKYKKNCRIPPSFSVWRFPPKLPPPSNVRHLFTCRYALKSNGNSSPAKSTTKI